MSARRHAVALGGIIEVRGGDASDVSAMAARIDHKARDITVIVHLDAVRESGAIPQIANVARLAVRRHRPRLAEVLSRLCVSSATTTATTTTATTATATALPTLSSGLIPTIDHHLEARLLSLTHTVCDDIEQRAGVVIACQAWGHERRGVE